MRTNIMIDDVILKQAMILSGLKTKKEVIAQALIEYVERHSREDLMDLQGKIQFSEGYDYRSLREEHR